MEGGAADPSQLYVKPGVDLIIEGQRVESLTVLPDHQRAAHGIGSATLMDELPMRRGQTEPSYIPLPAGDPGGSIPTDVIHAVRFRERVVDASGNERFEDRIIRLNDVFTLTPPGTPEATPAQPEAAPVRPPVSTPAVPPSADRPAAPLTPREQLESRIESQNLVIAGVKTKERRVYDLVNKSMERAKGWGKQAFKEVFEHKLTKYYGDLLDIAKSPFAEEAIKLAEQKGEAEYKAYYDSLGWDRKIARKVIEGFKAIALKTTWAQDATIRHLSNAQDQDIQAALSRGRQMYLDEKGAFAGRFDTAFDREDLAIRKDMGENFSQVAAQPYAQEIKTLIKQFTHGDIDGATFAAHKDALWGRIKTANPDLLKDAEDYADTLTAVGKQYKDQWNRAETNAEGKLRIDAEIDAMRVALGIGQMGEATSMNKTDTQKATGKLKEFSDFLVKKNIIGASLFNEATVGTAVSYALSVKSMGSMVVTSGARAVGGWVAGGAAAGVFGAAREKGRLTKEYWAYLGEREAGMQTTPGSKKREWFDQLDVKRRKSDEVVSALRVNLYDATGAVKTNLTDDEVRSTLGQLADAKARWALSSRKEKRVALIEIGGLGGQERNRTEFVRAMDQTEKDLGQYVAGHADVKASLMGGQEYDAFLNGLTTTQTQILDKGKVTFDALQQDSAQRLALTHVAGYAPEVEKLRRKILWLGGEKHAVGTASGLEAALKEFNTQANVEAARRGIATGAIGMGIGALTQELAMDVSYYKQFGWQGLDSIGHGAVAESLGVHHALPLSDMSDAIPGIAGSGDNVITHSQNMVFDGKFYDLVDRNGQVIHDNVIDATQLHFDHGQLTDDATKYVGDQMHKFGFEAQFSGDTMTHVPFSGKTNDLLFGPDKVTVPEELHWVENGDGTSRLVLDVQNSAGVPSEYVIVPNEVLVDGRPEHVEEVLKAIHNDPWLDVIPGKETIANIPPVRMDLTDLPSYPLADGTNHVLHATLPSGTQLVETNDGVFNLVDSHNPHNVLLHRIQIDEKGFISNLDPLNKSQEALTNHLHLNNTDYSVPLEGGAGGGTFDLRAGYLDDKTKYMGPDGVWGFGERVIGKGGPEDNLFKNAFRAWHNFDGSNNADIAQSEVPGVHRVIHRVAGGFKMSDGNIGYENSVDFNRLSDNAYIRDVPDTLFSDTNIQRYATLMEDTLKDANTWQSANPGADVNAVLAHLQATNELQYLAYKHGYIGQYFTQGDWDHFRELFEAPTSLDLHAPQIAQDLVSHGPPAISVVDTEVVNNIISLTAPEDQLPIPVIPILRRSGLEPGTQPLPIRTDERERSPSYSSFETIGQQSTLRNLIRISNPSGMPEQNDGQVRAHGGYMLNFREGDTKNITEGEGSLEIIRNTFQQSEHIYISLSGAIGDVVFTTAYIDGIRQYAERYGSNKKITLIVPSLVSTLLEPLAKKYNLEIKTEHRHQCVTKAHELIRSNNERNAIVFDFDFTEERGPYPILELRENGNITVHELLSTAVGLYTNGRSGDKRYAEYLGDLLHVTQNDRVQIMPVLPLPENAADIYRGFETRFAIDANKKQIAVILEGSASYKRYDIKKWLHVLTQIMDDDNEINVIFQEGGHYTEAQLRADLISIKNVKFIHAPLQELPVLLQHQSLVLSNDTGLAHVAATVENGPKVISLHSYNNQPNVWVTNPDRQIGIWSGANNKDVNEIQPNEIAIKALEILGEKLLITLPTPSLSSENPEVLTVLEPPKPVLLPGAKKILFKLEKLPNFDPAYKTRFEILANQLQSTASRAQQKAVLDQLRDLTITMEEDFKVKRGTPDQRQIENAGKLNVPVMQEWKRLDDRPLFTRLNDEKGTFDNLEVHPEQVPSQLGILVQQFATQFGLDPANVNVDATFEMGQWKITGKIPSNSQEFGLSLKPDKKKGFTVVDVTSAGFGAMEPLIPLALTPNAILTTLNGQLRNVLVSSLSIRPDGTLLFSGKHK